jgi:type 1 glutamine amidotransferase/glyoxylase-like metal-dependent hydrolase (beta-lactamase superfamily II)
MILRSSISPLVLIVAASAGAAIAQEALPHHEEIAPGVHAAGFADRFQSANCGWVELSGSVLLVDLPRGITAEQYLAEIKKTTKKPATALVLTHATAVDARIVEDLFKRGIKRAYLSPATHRSLFSGGEKSSPAAGAAAQDSFKTLTEATPVGDAHTPVEFQPHDESCASGAASLLLPWQKVLFAGPLVVNGPRTPLAATDTEAWSSALRHLGNLRSERVVPGLGSWGNGELVHRQLRFLSELRRQIGYFIAQGRPHEDLEREIRIVPDYLVWMPYDTPIAEDIEHVYRELTVPQAPFGARPPEPRDKRAHALVLIGDQPHEPAHLEEGLRPVFEATGVVPHFTVDVRALSAENLARVPLLVILRDGLQRPQAAGQPDYVWMTPEQEQAVVDFVHRGGGFLNLHNSMGLYPEDGPYLKLVGGRYIGHGPLERFRVEVVDWKHPVTRDVEGFSVADEQHTPPCDETKVHVLLRNRSDDGQTAAAGWVYEPGRGRLCHLANGHTREALLHPMYQQLMRNAVVWCLRQEPGGAKAPGSTGK